MKAKDYAEAYHTALDTYAEPIEALVRAVLHPLTMEFGELVKQRGSQSEAASLGCFREMEQKYAAVCRLISDEKNLVKPDGWRYYLQKIHPALWDLVNVMLLKERRK